MLVSKLASTSLTEEYLETLIGKFIDAPTNMHTITTPEGKEVEENVWFAGRVAGYEKSVLGFDYTGELGFNVPVTYRYALLLCDGLAYMLADDCELYELSEAEFTEKLEAFVAEQEAKKKIETIEKKIETVDNKKIILPDNKVIDLGGRK